jgi:hypothetical protein
MTNNKEFKSSVNIKFDLGNKDFFKGYLPTPSHAESLVNILSGFNNEDSAHSHIIIGPYGTGKSLLGTLISGMASKGVDGDTFDLLAQKFVNVDDAIYSELETFKKSKKRFLPVILNGNEGNFRQSVISAIIKTLYENKIDIIVPGIINKIFSTVEKWESEFPKTYKQFLKTLEESKKDLDVWRLNVLNYEREEIDWFRSIFPSLTSGVEFVVDHKEDFTEQIKYIVDQLDKKGLGLFLVYDEFGRFLQSLSSTMIHETMQDLQDLAELSDHYAKDLHLLLITHKNLRQYFLKFSEEFQNEFQRIEKRFRIYNIDSDQSTFIRITESLLSNLNNKVYISDEKYHSIVNNIRKFNLFSNLNQVEVENLVIKGSYPIHPVTLFLLPILSSVFAQNERTLFTFLQSNEPGGLLGHIKSNKNQFYLPSKLFNYFFPSSSLDEYEEQNNIFLSQYKNLKLRISSTDKDLDEIFKFITLWSLSNQQSKQKLSTEFLTFALDLDENKAVELLQKLESLKVIRFNRIAGFWELFEGSSIDLDNEINSRLEQTTLSKKAKVNILEKTLNKKFFLANNYNDDKSMTRYASVNIIYASDLLEKRLDVSSEEFKSDAIVNYVLIEEPVQREKLLQDINVLGSDNTFYSIPTKTIKEIEEDLLIYYTLTELSVDEEFVKKDKKLISELKIKQEDFLHKIREFMKVYSDFSDDLVWVLNGERVKIKSDIVLEKELSELMYKVYPLTPEIRNDSFNRRKINSVQQKAAFKVLDHILDYPNDKDISIQGKGPDYLIYATYFKNNELDITNLNTIKNKELKELRKDLLNKLEDNPSGSLADLTRVIESKPYGVRKPVIPLLLVSLLRDKWDQLMFYRNEMYVPGINGEKLYQMAEEASEYQFVFYNFNESYQTLFELLSETFGDYVTDTAKNSATPIVLSSGLLNWLRTLPRFTQITEGIEPEALKFREIIKRSEIDPRSTLENLFTIYSNNLNLLITHKELLENHLNMYKEVLKEKVFRLLNVSNLESLRKWSSNQSSIIRKNNLLVYGLYNIKGEESWIDDLALSVVGVRIEDWSDTTDQMFEQLINKDYNSIDKSVFEGDFITLSLNGEERSIPKTELSTKTQTIHKNVHRMIKNAGRNVPKEEIEFMIYTLVKEFVE